jgi:intracellular sulfur oxidation DsrE/DsrF family protein
VKKDEHISEEQLNAFVDSELDSEEKGSVLSAAERSPELDNRLCQHRKLKELVQHAYRDVPEPGGLGVGHDSRNRNLLVAAVAGVMLFVGLASGMLIQNHFSNNIEVISATGSSVSPIPASENYLVHVTSGDPVKMKMALSKASELLSSARAGHPRQVEVVANDKGLNLLRTDTTLFSTEISALAERNVVFYACSRAIRLLEEKGIEVHLVPEASSEFTALDRVLVRMTDGWNYIKI